MGRQDSALFEERARRALSNHYGVSLYSGSLPGVHKCFDLVSQDGRIVGDAKYYSLVGGVGRPPAKIATITEYVWLLEKTAASKTFLVFGNDRMVPMLWLKDYGTLPRKVAFYFLSDNGQLELLAGPTAQ